MTAPPLPKFAVDRCLGKVTPARLQAQGWNLALITDIYLHDAQETSDDTWLTWASTHLDGALTKDATIRRMPWYESATIPIFSLSRQDLTIDEMVDLFSRHKARIETIAASRPGRQFWTLYRTGEMKRVR